MSSRDLSDLLPRVAVAARAAIAACEAKGLSVLVTCTYRDGATQDALFAQGRETPGAIVTNARAGQSMHQYRCALDLVPLVNGKPDWVGQHPDWQAIAVIFKQHGFEWGEDWVHFKEMPHFQITDGHPLSFFQAGGDAVVTARPTTWEVRFGSGALLVAKRFAMCEGSDAVVRFAEAVVMLDRNPECGAGWATLSQNDLGLRTQLASWTKTSNERPAAVGENI